MPTSPARKLDVVLTELRERMPLSARSRGFLRQALKRYFSSDNLYELARPFGLTPTRRGQSSPRKAQIIGEPIWSHSGDIDDSGIWQVSFEIEKGAAHPEDVIATLRAISKALAANVGLSRRKAHFLTVALGRRENQPASTFEQAFGLKRPSIGRPGPPIERRQQIARDVLLSCLNNAGDLRSAAIAVGSEHRLSATQVIGCWRRHKLEAIYLAQVDIAQRFPHRNRRPFRWRAAEQLVLQRLLARDYAKLARAGIALRVR